MRSRRGRAVSLPSDDPHGELVQTPYGAFRFRRVYDDSPDTLARWRVAAALLEEVAAREAEAPANALPRGVEESMQE